MELKFDDIFNSSIKKLNDNGILAESDFNEAKIYYIVEGYGRASVFYEILSDEAKKEYMPLYRVYNNPLELDNWL